ncbi:MAG: metalloregulator ArsR/SmtB family transcription factor [Lachnospiraceae bacterium]|nr:metalloregulator ArsR/SmtB family transcription factor [Lachnospiraceae bacterium]
MANIQLPHKHEGNPFLDISHIPDAEQFRTAADILKLLGDASRIRIFWILCHCETCVINLSAMVEMSSPAVSHHLRQLKAAGLVTSRREGKEMYYTAAKNPEADLLHHTIEQMLRISCPTTEH